ncbi:hypothetical protein H4582DRAFT_2072924 [Lactarius indigo]|nr:hypothetical protein H4582DRAFT_2072924 [Lactarius indigo]
MSHRVSVAEYDVSDPSIETDLSVVAFFVLYFAIDIVWHRLSRCLDILISFGSTEEAFAVIRSENVYLSIIHGGYTTHLRASILMEILSRYKKSSRLEEEGIAEFGSSFLVFVPIASTRCPFVVPRTCAYLIVLSLVLPPLFAFHCSLSLIILSTPTWNTSYTDRL